MITADQRNTKQERP